MDIIELLLFWLGLMLFFIGNATQWLLSQKHGAASDINQSPKIRRQLDQQQRLLQHTGGLMIIGTLLALILAHGKFLNILPVSNTLALQSSILLTVPFASLLGFSSIVLWNLRHIEAISFVRVWHTFVISFTPVFIGGLAGTTISTAVLSLISLRNLHANHRQMPHMEFLSAIFTGGSTPNIIVLSGLTTILCIGSAIFLSYGRHILQQVLQATPIPLFSSRTLSALQQKAIAAQKKVSAFAIGYISTGIVFYVVALGSMIPELPKVFPVEAAPYIAKQAVPAPTPHAPIITVDPPTPVVSNSTPIIGFSGAMQQTDHGITIILASNTLHIGPNAITFDYQDSTGNTPPSLIPTLIITRPTTSDGSSTIASTHIDTDIQGRHHATIDFPHDGEWNVVIVLANSEQTVLATGIFTVDVGD